MTREELAAALRKADAAGNADDARRLAGAIRQLDASAVSAPTPAKPAPMSQPDATPWGDGQAFDDMYARKPQTDPMNMPLMPGARTLTSGQPTRMKPPPAPRGPVMSPAQRRATQPDRDEAARVRKYNEELALMNAASPIPFKNTGPDGPLELNQERPDLFAGRATGAFVNSNIGVANLGGQVGLSTANAYGAGFDPSMQGALAGGEYGDITQRVADAAQQGGYVQNQQAVGDIIPSLPIPAATTPGEMGADVIGNLASVFTGFGAPILKGGKALSESLATVPGMSRTLRGVGVETGENAALAYGVSAGAAPPGSDRNMAGTQGAADPLNYVSIEAARAVPRALKALDAPTTPTNAGGVGPGLARRQMPPAAPAVAATQTAQQAPTQPQTVTAPPVPPTPPNAPAVTAGAPQPVPARSRAEQRADDLFIKKLEADGLTVEDLRKIQARLARRGDSGVYETSGELAALSGNSSGANVRGLQMAGGAAPGPLQEALVGIVNQNTEKLSPRLSRGATRATGQKADNAVATLDELETRLRTEATPAYDTAYATPVNPEVFANELLPVLNTPSGQKALQAARNNLASIAADLQGRAARGASERATMEAQRAQAAVKSIDDFMADPVRGTAIPTTMALDYTKRAFDDVIADAGFGSDTARIVGGTKRNFADSVSQATGGQYGNALGVFEDVKRLEDAFETGLKSLSQPTWELQRAMAKGRNGSPWTAGEVEALAMGVARNIEDLIEANNQSALTKLLKDKALKNMATALGSQKAADMFEETIRRLGANREWGRRVAGGSDTAMRQAAIRDAGMEGEDAVTRVLDRVETSGNQFSLPGLVNDVAVKPIARTAKDIYQRLRYPGVYDEEVNRALIPLIGKPMTEGNLNEVIRRVEARMAEKGLIPPAQPAAVAAPPPAPGRRPRGPRGNPPGTTSSASATGTGIVAGGVLGAMAPADDENEQFINALFTAAGVGTAVGVAAKLSKGGKPPPANGKGAKPKAPPAKPAFDQRFMKEAQRLVSYNGGVDKALKAQQYVIDQLKNSKAPNAQDRLNRAVSVQYAIRRMAERSNRELDEIVPMADAAPTGPKPIDPNTNYNIDPRGDKFVIRTDAGEEVLGAPQFSDRKQALAWLQGETRKARQGGAASAPRSGPPGVKPPPVKNGFGGSRDLPMDEASRMSRAREMGFDTGRVAYRGLGRAYDESGKGGGRRYQMFTSSESDAAEYGSNVVSAYLRKGNNLQLDGGGRNFNSVSVSQLPDDVRAKLHPSIQGVARIDDIADAAQKAGYDSVTVANVFDNAWGEVPTKPRPRTQKDIDFDNELLRELGVDPADMPSAPRAPSAPKKNTDPVTIDVVFDTKNIRSVNAKFDPSESSSSKLLAGMSGNADAIGAGTGAVLAPDVDGDGEVSFGERAGAAITGGVIGNVARRASGTGAPKVKPPPAGKFRGPSQQTFAGVNAKTADKVALGRAQNMEAEGASREEIIDATGWFKQHGDWKFEIDDSGAQVFNPAAGNFVDFKRLKNRMTDADAGGAYPELSDMTADFRKSKSTSGAAQEEMTFRRDSENPRWMIAAQGPDAAAQRSIALHERQHIIQQNEGFASGASPDDFIPKDKQGKFAPFTQIGAYRKYRKTAGETEARNVQTRRDFTPEQRRARRPWETQDVPDDQQIVRFGSGKAESRPTPPKGQKAPPKGPGTLSRMVAGGAVGGIAGSLGGDANAQEDLTAEMAKTEGQISTVQQEIAALKKAKADFDKMTDVKEKQRFLNRAGDYNGAIDGDIKGLTTAGIKAWDARNAAALAKAEKELTASRTTLDDLRTQDAYRQMQKEQNPFFDAVRELGPSGAAVLGGVAATVLRMRGVGKSAKAVKQIENDINDLLTNGPVKGLLKKGGAANQPRNRAVNMNEFYRRGGAPDDKLPFNYGAAGWKPNPKAAKPGSLYSKKTTTGMDGVGSQFLRPTDIKVIGAGLLDSALVTPFVSGAEEELKKAKEDVENGNESIEALRRVEKAKTDLAMYQAIQRLGWGIAGAGALGVAYRYKLPRPDIRGAEDEVTAIADYLKSKAPPKTPRTPKALPPPPAPPQPPAIAASPSQLLLPLLPPPPAPKKPKPKPKKP